MKTHDERKRKFYFTKERSLSFLGLLWLISLCACSKNLEFKLNNSTTIEVPSDTTEITEPVDSTNFSTSENPFVCGTEGYACYRIPTLAVTKKGTILAFAEGRREDCDDAGDIDIVLKRSKDNGKTWSNIITVKDDGINRCQNQCPIVLPSGRILLVTCWNLGATGMRSVLVTYSDNDGLTWAKEKNITSSVKLSSWGSWYATGPCHGIVKQQEPNKGRVIVPCNHGEGTKGYSHVIYSDDDGITWALGGIVAYGKGNESTVAELSTGDIMINMRNSDTKSNHFRMIAISKDGGKTFSSNYPDSALIEPGSGCQGVLLRHSINAVTGKANILFSNPNHGTSRRDGTIKLSEDDGNTWTKSYLYADYSENDIFYTGYSDMALLDDGNIALLYEKGFKYSLGIRFMIVKFSDIK